MLRPNPWLSRRLMLLGVVAGVGVGAFCWGRHGALPEADAQGPTVPQINSVAATPGMSTADYARRVVAYIYDKMPVTREELGEYLIARFGKDRVEFLVNRKIVEMACQQQGIVITDGQVDAQYNIDIASFGKDMTRELFKNQVLKRFGKSEFEWKEDVIRPKLAMQALAKPYVKVTPKDVQDEFEARYGPKVECRMIVLPKDDPHRTQTWDKVRQSAAAFEEAAGSQGIAELASRKGVIPAIHKHYPDPNLEKEAFALKDGEVSSLIQAPLPDGSWIILRRERAVLPDQEKKIENEWQKLVEEVQVRKLAEEIPRVFAEMRKNARVEIILGREGPSTPQAQFNSKLVPPPVGN
jgi:hypothetical protein